MKTQSIKNVCLKVFLCCLVCLLAPDFSFSKDVTQKKEAQKRWITIAPFGVAVQSLLVDPKHADTVYAATHIGIFKTVNGGKVWTPKFYHHYEGVVRSTLKFDPKSFTTLYYGVSTVDEDKFQYARGDIYKSVDAGENWRDIGAGTISGKAVFDLAIDPVSTNTLYVAADNGFFKSLNGGKSYGRIIGHTNRGHSILVDPGQPSRVFFIGQVYYDNGNSGIELSLSEDGGQSFSNIGKNMVIPWREIAHDVLFAPDRKDTFHFNDYTYCVFIGVLSEAKDVIVSCPQKDRNGHDHNEADFVKIANGGKGVVNSSIKIPTHIRKNDDESSLDVFSNEESSEEKDYFIDRLAITIDEEEKDVMYTAALTHTEGFTRRDFSLYKTVNGGKSWDVLLAEGLPRWPLPSSVSIVARQNIVFVNTVRGVYKSTDGGQNFQSATMGLLQGVLHTLSLESETGVIYFTPDQDHYSSGIYKSKDSGNSWEIVPIDTHGEIIAILNPLIHKESLYLLIDENVYHLTDKEKTLKRVNIPPGETGTRGIVAADSKTLYWLEGKRDEHSCSGVSVSEDGGFSWRKIRNFGKCLKLLTVDKNMPTVAYIGAGANLYKTVDKGENWMDLTQKLQQPIKAVWQKSKAYGKDDIGRTLGAITSVTIDPTRSKTVYVGTQNAGIYKTIDGGDTWKSVNKGIMDMERLILKSDAIQKDFLRNPLPFLGKNLGHEAGFFTVNDVAVNPKDPNNVYAGTDAGVFRSSDGGNSWQSMNDGLFHSDVSQVLISNTSPEIIIARIGRSIYNLIEK